jgi:hypothetical protein
MNSMRCSESFLFSLGERRVKKADLIETGAGADILGEQSSC